MRTNIIKIGNSKGLILSKTILEKYQIKNEVNVTLEDDYLIIELSIKYGQLTQDE